MIAAACAHHWEVEEARGATSRAMCRLCGERKQMANYLEERWDKGGKLVLAAPAVDPPAEEVTHMAEKTARNTPSPRQKSLELAPARRRAEELFRQGKNISEVAQVMAAEFSGVLNRTTLHHWWYRLRPEASGKDPPPPAPDPGPDQAKAAPVASAAEPLPQPGTNDSALLLWELVMASRPSWAEKPRLGRWMDLVDAVYAFLVET